MKAALGIMVQETPHELYLTQTGLQRRGPEVFTVSTVGCCTRRFAEEKDGTSCGARLRGSPHTIMDAAAPIMGITSLGPRTA